MKFVFISFFLVVLTININLINSQPILANIYNVKNMPINQFAKKYCDSQEKNLFKGLDKELTLKYQYFFSSIPNDFIKDENEFLKIFKSDVKSICSYKISQSDEKELKSFLKYYFKIKINTPKINVEAINPTPIKPAIMPLLR